MDLKALLLEAKQKVPPVLQVLHCGDESMLDIGGKCRVGAPSPVWGWEGKQTEVPENQSRPVGSVWSQDQGPET